MQLLSDFRYGVRMMAKAPGSASVAVLALALGIGANTFMFSEVNALLLHPLPFPDLDRVVGLWETTPKQGGNRLAVSPANFLDWRERSRSFARLAAVRYWPVTLTGRGEPERVEGYQVSPDFFPLLGIPPALGRTFLGEEAQPGRSQVAVVSSAFWKGRLGGDPGVVGKTLTLGGRSLTIVGVMPAALDFPLGAELWSPLALTPEERAEREIRSLSVIGRLKSGATVAQAQAEMEAIAARIAAHLPRAGTGTSATVLRLLDVTNVVTDRFLVILLAAAGFVLLLACANVANLQLARATGRRREMAIRAALGAGRGRLARQLLAENLALAGAGAVLAVLVSAWALSLWSAAVPEQVLKWVAGLRNVRIDGTVLAFTAAAAVLTGVLCGLAPAIQSGAGRRLSETLKQGGRGTAGDRGLLRRMLVVSEVALALILLVGAGLMVQTFRHISTIDAGYDPRNLLTMRVTLPENQFREPAQASAYQDEALRRLGALPQVKAAAASAGSRSLAHLAVEGRPAPPPGEPLPDAEFISPDYFAAMGIPLLRGRPVEARDDTNAPLVVVLSESVAERFWRAGEDPIGSRVRISPGERPFTVVGVVGDTRDWFFLRPLPTIYLAARQAHRRSLEFLVRTTGDPVKLASAARAQILSVDRAQAVYDVKTMEQRLAEQTSGVRISAQMMSAFGFIALALAAAGIYAVISYSVAQRTQEIGLRMALGAARRDVLRLVVGQAFLLAGAGFAIGLPAAYALSRLASSGLYGVFVPDAVVFAAFTLLLAGIAALAAYVPARSAASVDPIIALRYE